MSRIAHQRTCQSGPSGLPEYSRSGGHGASALLHLSDIDYAVAAAAATVGFGAGREIASAINAATMHSAPATKKAGR